MPTDIRKQAEELLRGKTADKKKLHIDEVQSLVHELQMHQNELEMQNEELRKVQNVLEETRNRYSDLYDFAPTGYFTFDKNGLIFEVNLTGAKKLGRERAYLIKKPFSLYVAPDYKDAFYSHLRQVFDTGTQTTCELQLVDKNRNIFDAKLESIPVHDSDGNLLCRTAMSDITERKLAEVALKKNETSLKKAQELGKIGNWELDLKTQKINWSDEVYVLYERDKKLGPPTVEEEAKYYAPEVSEKLHEFARLATETSQEYRYDFTIRLPNGRNAFFNISIIPVKDDMGNVIQLWGTVQDITERKQIEVELEESESRYRRLFEAAQDGILILDADTGKITDVNPFLLNILGYSYEELCGKKLWEIRFLKDIEASKAAFLELQTKGYIRYEDMPLKTKDGRSIDFEFVSNVYLVNNKKVIQCNIRDITERKQVEKISQEARLYAENIIETVREPFVVLDKDLKVLSASRSFYSTFEVTPDATVGNLIYDIGNRQWDIPSLRTLLEDILPKDTQFINYEVSHKFQTIGQKTMLLNARQIYQEVIGRPIILLAIEDITERKRAEKLSQEARIYAENIIETVREPLLVLDKDLKVLSANFSFYNTFEVTADETLGNLIYEIGNRQWDIPSLRTLLEEILPQKTEFINYEVSHKFQTIGQKIMLLNARQIYQEVIGTPIILLAIEDITEKRRIEKISQEARLYAESIIDTVREPFVVLDKDLKVLSASRSFYTNFEVTPDETVGNLIYDIGNRQWDIPSLRTLLEEILPEKTQFNNYEVSHKFQTIGQKTMLLNARQIYQEVIGTPIILLAIEDITEKRRIEKISQEARLYAESIIDTVREPFVVLDKDLKVLSASRSFYTNFEVTPDETVGNLIYDIGNRQWDIPSLRTLLEDILPKETQFNNYEVSHKFQTIGQKTMLLNARQIYQEVIGTPIILLAIEDITERKNVEKVAQEARLYAENIIETVREPLVALDKDLKVLSANHSFYSTFEVTPVETVGNLIYDIGNRQWDIPSLRTLLEEILPEKTQFNNYEVSHKFQTIGQKTMLLNARQIYQEVIGTPIILLAIEDITERKQMDEELKKHREHLEELVTERTLEARLAKEEAEHANMAKTIFLQTISHELRTPLNAILGFSEILKGKTSGELNEKQEHFMDNIITGGKSLANIINQILDIVKMYEGKSELRIEKIHVPETLDEIIGVIKENATKKNVLIEKKLDMELEYIDTDKQKFKQVFINLLDNAVKFSKDEGGTVTIIVKKEGDMAKFSISDRGLGIKEEDLEEIFQKFTQLDSGTSRKYGGMGIGLAITKQFVELLGGKIYVESKPGVGSTFTFLLPLKPKNREKPQN